MARKSRVEAAASSAIWPYLQLMRPPNLITAAADILAGYAVAGLPDPRALPWLLAAAVGLYGGGVVFNDFFDAELDAVERPERPIPSGRVPIDRAALLGSVLLLAGVAAAFQANPVSGLIALAIALFALLYDIWGKERPIFGATGMGLCRGLNFLLGVSAAPFVLGQEGFLALIAFFYITAVTVLSKGEVHGGRPGRGRLSLGLLFLGMIPLIPGRSLPEMAALSPFLILFVVRVVPPFWRAARTPSAHQVRAAVKAGVLSLIVLDAAIAAGHAGFLYGFIVFSLSFFAGRMARLFAVT